MKALFSVLYHGWLVAALFTAIYAISTEFVSGWLGVLLTSVPPLLNRIWCFDNGDSPAHKTRYPKLSLLMLVGVAWVLLTVDERTWMLWLALGCLGGFLLYSYWATDNEDSHL